MLQTSPGTRFYCLLWWLGKIAAERPAFEALWWDGKSARADRLVEWFAVLRRVSANRALAVLLRDVLKAVLGNPFQTNPEKRIEHLLSGLSDAKPQVSAEILRVLFARWFAHHPDMHPFDYHDVQGIDISALATLAERAPNVFLDGAIPTLVQAVRVVHGQNSSIFGACILYQETNRTRPCTQ